MLLVSPSCNDARLYVALNKAISDPPATTPVTLKSLAVPWIVFQSGQAVASLVEPIVDPALRMYLLSFWKPIANVNLASRKGSAMLELKP